MSPESSMEPKTPAETEAFPSRSLINFQDSCECLRKERLWLQVLIGLGLGVGAGFALGPDFGIVAADAAERIGGWLALPGELFLATIKFVVVPLVAASVIRGIAAGGDASNLRRIGVRIVIYFLFTTAVAVTIGSVIAYLIVPGAYVDPALVKTVLADASEMSGVAAPAGQETLPSMIVGLVPTLIARLSRVTCFKLSSPRH